MERISVYSEIVVPRPLVILLLEDDPLTARCTTALSKPVDPETLVRETDRAIAARAIERCASDPLVAEMHERATVT